MLVTAGASFVFAFRRPDGLAAARRPRDAAGGLGRSRHLLADKCSRALDEQGQALIEYAFVVVLIALVLMLVVAVLGHQTNTLYSNVSNALPM